MLIYITIMQYGSYEDRTQTIIYCGADYEIAKERALAHKFPDPDQNFGWVEFWENGDYIKQVEIVG
jgi:hypothetical protein